MIAQSLRFVIFNSIIKSEAVIFFFIFYKDNIFFLRGKFPLSIFI